MPGSTACAPEGVIPTPTGERTSESPEAKERCTLSNSIPPVSGEQAPAQPTDGGEEEKDEENFLAMSAAADADEWSAALVTAGVLQSLVRCLKACVDARSLLADKSTRAEAVEALAWSGKTVSSVADRANRTDNSCLGCELEVAQVEVMLAIGGLLSAHPLAARDRFHLVGGALTFRQVISTPHDDENAHDCLLSSGDVGTTTTTTPFVHEHCCLVAVQVLRLCLRAGAPDPVPFAVAEGAVRLLEGLPPVMRGVWENRRYSDRVAVCGNEPRSHAVDSVLRRDRSGVGDGQGQSHDGGDDDNECRRSTRWDNVGITDLSSAFLRGRCPEKVELPGKAGDNAWRVGVDLYGRGDDLAMDGATSAANGKPRATAQAPLSADILSYRLCG